MALSYPEQGGRQALEPKWKTAPVRAPFAVSETAFAARYEGSIPDAGRIPDALFLPFEAPSTPS